MQIIYILNLIEAKYDIKQTIFVIFRCKTKVLNCYIYSLPNNIACAWVGENNEKGAVWGVLENMKR